MNADLICVHPRSSAANWVWVRTWRLRRAIRLRRLRSERQPFRRRSTHRNEWRQSASRYARV